ITDPSPVQLFKLQSLTKGDAKISVYNTVMTAEVDPNSSINKGRPDANMTQDLFREFKWSDGAGTLVVTMSRLEQNSNGGLWEVTSVTSPGMSITTPQDRDRLTCPTTVQGKGNAFEGKIGKVVVLDHLYTDIGHSDANGATGNGSTTFSSNVSYSASFKTGIQEGIVVLYSYSNADGSVAGAVMVKEMLS
ncbi:MAG: hypothetical protein E6J04_05285, partial [Chloroflexi bacterium]